MQPRRRRVLSHTPPPSHHKQNRFTSSSLSLSLSSPSSPSLSLPSSSTTATTTSPTSTNPFRRTTATTTNSTTKMMEMMANHNNNNNNNMHDYHHSDEGMASTSTETNGQTHPPPFDDDDDARNPDEPIPMFAFSEIRLGRMVGRGGFSVVHEVDRIVLEEVYDTSAEDSARRKALANRQSHSSSSSSSSSAASSAASSASSAASSSLIQQRYVLKTLRTDLPEEEHVKGIVDLAIEADFLQRLHHANIITMRAMANSDPHESKFFVILDPLVMTLDRKFNAWRKQVGENIGIWLGPCCGYCCAKRPALYQIWLERLQVARDIAKALSYLHSQSIVYRDLKPDNCGFNAQGQLKLFDFGLAKRMDPHDRTANGLYTMTGNTGSLRYMAPEVANCLPYDQRCDAYSFGVLFWQICSLTTPYAGYSLNMHAERVVRLGQRPKPDHSWPSTWSNVMTECWAANYTTRPPMEAVVSILTQEVMDMEHDDGMMIPTRATEKIRAKQRKQKKLQQPNQLDVDTRLSEPPDATLQSISLEEGPGVKRFDNNIV